MVKMTSADEGIEICKELKEHRKDVEARNKIGWYFRYWPKEEGLKAHSKVKYQEYIDTNPMFIAMAEGKKKKKKH